MGAGARWFAGLGLTALVAAGTEAWAEPPPTPAAAPAPSEADEPEPDGPEPDGPEIDEPEADDDAPRAEVTVGLDVMSAYYDRGLLIEAEQVVVQPWVAVDVPLVVCTGTVRDVRFVADVWGSFQDGASGLRGAPHAPRAWYEGDAWLGLAAHVGEALDVRLDYGWSWSPNGSYERFEEVALELSLDDEPRWEGCGRFRGFAPTLIVAREVRGQNDDGDRLGTYLEAKIEPRWALARDGDPEVDVSLPLRLGASLGGYYQGADGDDDVFGFLEAGARLSVGLGRLSGRLEAVTASLTVGGLWLGDHVADAGDGRRSRLVVGLGLEVGL